MKSVILAAKIEDMGVRATPYDTIEEGVAAAIKKASDGRPVIAIGSLYFSADVKKTRLKERLMQNKGIIYIK